MLNDPIVAEIHQTRKRMMAECGNDLTRLLARLREREAEDANRVVSSVEDGRRWSRERAAIAAKR